MQYQYRPGTISGWLANKLAKYSKQRRSECPRTAERDQHERPFVAASGRLPPKRPCVIQQQEKRVRERQFCAAGTHLALQTYGQCVCTWTAALT